MWKLLIDGKFNDIILYLKIVGVMQHHDAITGTEKEHVARDYSRILEAGIQDCLKTSEKALK